MNTFYDKYKLTIHVSIAGLVILFSTLIFSNAFKSRVKNNNMISVWGLGTKDFVSDLIVWNGSFTRKNSELKIAYELLDKDRAVIKSYLISKGVKEKEIVFSSVEITKEFEMVYDNRTNTQTNVFSGYRLNQKVNIESMEVEKTEEVSRQVTELINKGVEFYSESPQYYYTKLSDLKLEMIALAAEDGRKRAEAIASKSKSGLGKLRFANTDMFQITAKYASEAFTYGGVFNTSSKIKTATITIKIQYDIN